MRYFSHLHEIVLSQEISIFLILRQCYFYCQVLSDPVAKNTANAGDTKDAGLIRGLGRSNGVINGNPLQYSCLENSMDRRAWWATVYGVAKS